MDVEGNTVHSSDLTTRFAAEWRGIMREDLGEVSDFDQGHGPMLTVAAGRRKQLGYPEEIIGTAAKAASNPTNFQRLKCSFKTRRASRTVTAG